MQHIISGSNDQLWLGVHATQGTASTRYPEDNVRQNEAYHSNYSNFFCGFVDQMLNKAREFPPLTIEYGGLNGPNSNTVARVIGEAGSFRPAKPTGACGWEAQLSW